MSKLHLKIITPKKVALESDIKKITVPSTAGEITILPHHENLFSLLAEGVVKFTTTDDDEEYLAIGGGYLETDGALVELLVTKAYGQDSIDKNKTHQAIEDARRDIKESKDKQQVREATANLRKSLVDMKLLKKKAPKSFSGSSNSPDE
jgi:F-type H+-transporting ATPase subunit epsilon